MAFMAAESPVVVRAAAFLLVCLLIHLYLLPPSICLYNLQPVFSLHRELLSYSLLRPPLPPTLLPSPVQIHSMSCGPATFAVAADRSVITWGHGQ
jgi:hypothetical protein